jgi:hypothetical protein
MFPPVVSNVLLCIYQTQPDVSSVAAGGTQTAAKQKSA